MTHIFNALSPAQINALAAVKHWLEHDTATKPIFTLFGYAGTGKSTLAAHVAELLNGNVVFLTYTGKAASVLRQKGCDTAQTLHSALYRPIDDETQGLRFVRNDASDIVGSALVVIDECSMVDDVLLRDLRSFGVPILAMGDPGQLPPVKGVGVLRSVTPDVFLTEIHRQAAGNPVLQLADMARRGAPLSLGQYGSSRVISQGDLTMETLLEADQIIVGTNDLRHQVNASVRERLGRSGDMPVDGDRLVCLKNHGDLGISNGELFVACGTPVVQGDTATFHIRPEDGMDQPFEVTISISQFLSGKTSSEGARKQKPQFDFGYAITCHKAQGSQWNNVLVIDQSVIMRENANAWLYTAITRAANSVIVAI
ncbi:MAG: ATP-dependent DNA helicase [Marivita sp.]|uniref:ATP-dependent DNA helicase n=1 Tax=Marivita sp. TaxID=2003365 RepID=UPI003EF8296B